jgi:exopolysaccharide production protein ExoZ
MVAGGLAGLFPNMRLTGFHVLASFAFIPHFSPSDGGLWPVLVQGWTLNYEMFFYALFAMLLPLTPRNRLAAMACLFIGLVGLGLLVPPESAALKTYTSPLLLEFLIGLFIGRLWLSGKIPSARTGWMLIAIAGGGFAFVGATYIGFNAYVLGTLAGILLLGVLALEKDGRVRRFASAAYLGDASYSIYLWHTMAISVAVKLAAATSLPPPLALSLAIASGTAIGLACHQFLEKPITAFLKTRSRTSSASRSTPSARAASTAAKAAPSAAPVTPRRPSAAYPPRN